MGNMRIVSELYTYLEQELRSTLYMGVNPGGMGRGGVPPVFGVGGTNF